jgi:uncharacterized protein YjbI with pentapeptide repeats
MAIKKMTPDEFFSLYAAGERDFFEVEITDADMSRATGWEKNRPIGQAINGACMSCGNYSGSNFNANDMRGSTFGESKMVQCQFIAAELTGTGWNYTDLSGSTFEGAKLVRAELIEANLAGCDFVGADLTEADFTGADISGANFEGALFCKTTMSDGSIVEGPYTPE